MKIKNLIYVMLCICAASLLSGCGRWESENPDLTPTSEATPTPLKEENPTGQPIEPPQNKEVMIYSINADTLEKTAVTVLMSEVTAELIVEEVVSAMKDAAFFVGINDVILQEDTVIVDFRSDAPPVADVGASIEGSILDAIAQSIIDNLPQYSKVIYHIEGNAYVTGHFEMKQDEIYMER